MAINVLVNYIISIDRALDFANKINKPEVWKQLANILLVLDTNYFYDFLLTYLL
jgi:hypothetical protein